MSPSERLIHPSIRVHEARGHEAAQTNERKQGTPHTHAHVQGQQPGVEPTHNANARNRGRRARTSTTDKPKLVSCGRRSRKREAGTGRAATLQIAVEDYTYGRRVRAAFSPGVILLGKMTRSNRDN